MTAKEASKETLEAYVEYVRRSIIWRIPPLEFEKWYDAVVGIAPDPSFTLK